MVRNVKKRKPIFTDIYPITIWNGLPPTIIRLLNHARYNHHRFLPRGLHTILFKIHPSYKTTHLPIQINAFRTKTKIEINHKCDMLSFCSSPDFTAVRENPFGNFKSFFYLDSTKSARNKFLAYDSFFAYLSVIRTTYFN